MEVDKIYCTEGRNDALLELSQLKQNETLIAALKTTA